MSIINVSTHAGAHVLTNVHIQDPTKHQVVYFILIPQILALIKFKRKTP